MSLRVGIVGLPNVGKSTLFNALLKKQQAYVANFPFATIEPNVGVIPVPDERLNQLQAVVGSQSTVVPPIVPATVEFVDIAGLIAGAHKGEGLGNKFLSHIREVDAIAHVLRAFSDPDIIREGSVDPKSDFEIVKTELDLADYEMLEKSKIKMQNSKLQSKSQNDLPLFSKKPFLVALNVDEQGLSQSDILTQKYSQELGVSEDQIVVISAKVEAELAGLSEEEQKQYLADLGVEQSGLERLAQKAFATLRLITFLTAGEKEVRAWTIKLGTNALNAAGEIHTDFVQKFIKAEVVKFDDFVEVGGWKRARELGKTRLEGKDYIVQDGDVIEFKIGS